MLGSGEVKMQQRSAARGDEALQPPDEPSDSRPGPSPSWQEHCSSNDSVPGSDDGNREALRQSRHEGECLAAAGGGENGRGSPSSPVASAHSRHLAKGSSWRGRRPGRQYFSPSSRSMIWGSRHCATNCPLFLTPSSLKYHCSNCPFGASPDGRKDSCRGSADFRPMSGAASASTEEDHGLLEDSRASGTGVICVEDAAFGGAPGGGAWEAASAAAQPVGARVQIVMSDDEEPCWQTGECAKGGDDRGCGAAAAAAGGDASQPPPAAEEEGRSRRSPVESRMSSRSGRAGRRSRTSSAPHSPALGAHASSFPAEAPCAGTSAGPASGPLVGATDSGTPGSSAPSSSSACASPFSVAASSERSQSASSAAVEPLSLYVPASSLEIAHPESISGVAAEGDGIGIGDDARHVAAASPAACDACPFCLDACEDENCAKCLPLRSLAGVLSGTGGPPPPPSSASTGSPGTPSAEQCTHSEESPESLFLETSSDPVTPPGPFPQSWRPASTPAARRDVGEHSAAPATSSGRCGWFPTRCLQMISPPSPLPEYTLCQVARHCRQGGCWIVAHDYIYDALPILYVHPGGPGCLLRKSHENVDCSRDYDFHSRRGRQLWERLLVGRVESCPGWKRQQQRLDAPMSHTEARGDLDAARSEQACSGEARQAESPSELPGRALTSETPQGSSAGKGRTGREAGGRRCASRKEAAVDKNWCRLQ
ncbi:hypothetical protein BESB_012850 [Besnoitia besnoiti]|uniref:Cytochrome b5 heme-binding domain-containing protein n=1 Tax=Besnoitia besnoiti TaxID=94643 RepID=A0A2A9MAF5_BESBE|nr:hypothetical protein BESB_012850 [Besnoitia besnoiti]PFH32673.1 hypothetical protein BESB_012850 [Besnoitia besnoiti]